MKKVVRNLHDLARYFSIAPETCEDIEGMIKHRLYKYTACGAYIGFEEKMAVSSRVRKFQVACSASILGPVCTGWRANGRGPWRLWNDPKTPPELIAYFGTYPEPTFCGPYKELLRLPEDLGTTIGEIREKACNVRWQKRFPYRCWVELQVTKYGPGIVVGSIVEGSDVGTEEFDLAYPFTPEQLESAIKEVEGQASVLWDRANVQEDVQTTIKDGRCTVCTEEYRWPDGEPYRGPDLCPNQCPLCGDHCYGPYCACSFEEEQGGV